MKIGQKVEWQTGGRTYVGTYKGRAKPSTSGEVLVEYEGRTHRIHENKVHPYRAPKSSKPRRSSDGFGRQTGGHPSKVTRSLLRGPWA